MVGCYQTKVLTDEIDSERGRMVGAGSYLCNPFGFGCVTKNYTSQPYLRAGSLIVGGFYDWARR